MKTTFAGIEMGSAEFADEIAGSLRRVEDLLISELSSGEDFLTEAATHLAKAGGKRFRPLFALLSAQFGPNPRADEVVTAATVIELIHLATLYHDDVMDEATMRRGAVSANARWGNSVAILAGDFLFARASRLVSTLGPNSVLIIADTFAELVTGQMRETIGSTAGTTAVDHYLKVVWEKTAVLISAAGRFGAMTSGADAATTIVSRASAGSSAPPSRSPTTSSTSVPHRAIRARRPEPTCVKVCTPFPCSSPSTTPSACGCASCCSRRRGSGGRSPTTPRSTRRCRC